MKRNLFTLALVLFALFALPLMVMAQDVDPVTPPSWALGLPTILSGLVLSNLGMTEWFKRTLANLSDSKRIPFELAKDVQGTATLVFSIGSGLIMAALVPHANDWVLGQYPDMDIVWATIITGLSVSRIGGIVYEALGRLKGNSAIYETKTTISTPTEGTSDSTAKATLAVASQAVSESAKG